MRRAIILQHLDREEPGVIANLCQQRGLGVEIVRLDRGTPTPSTLESGDVLVVMGGSMGVADVADPRYPFLAQEIDLLRRVLAQKQPVLGICLGSQLLAAQKTASKRLWSSQVKRA